MAPKISTKGCPPNSNIEISQFISKVRENSLSLNKTEIKQLLDVVIHCDWDEDDINLVNGKIKTEQTRIVKRIPGPGRGKTDTINIEKDIDDALSTINANILDLDEEHVVELFKLLSNFQLPRSQEKIFLGYVASLKYPCIFLDSKEQIRVNVDGLSDCLVIQMNVIWG